MLIKNLKTIRPLIGSIENLIYRLNSSSSNLQNSFKYDVVSPQSFKVIKREFPSHIQLPVYAENGLNDDHIFENKILNYENLSRDQTVIKGVRNSCSIAKQILQNVKHFIKPGISGEQIDEFIYQQCLKFNCYPSPLNYNSFPKCVTISVNNVASHGIPDERQLIVGDILKVDVSIYFKGFHADTAETFLIGFDKAIDCNNLSPELIDLNVIDKNGLNLIRTAKECLDEAIKICRAGVHLNELGYTIEKVAKENGFNVVPCICGHSLAEYLHGIPQIVHCPFDEYTEYDRLLENMLVTIEPVICEKEPDMEILEDNWTIRTEDNGRTAQFEHTILIKNDHAEILT